jgi:phosphatidylinositol alpha-1,6-mannosyltransferase
LAQYVQFLGETIDDDLIRCYQQCDLFVLPNREVNGDIEGFGMVLVEAQACGRPVVAGDSGGTAETMRVGETGHIVCCNDTHALAKIVSELLIDDQRRARMGQAARAWAVSQFDWDALAKRADELFRSLESVASSSSATAGPVPAEQ